MLKELFGDYICGISKQFISADTHVMTLRKSVFVFSHLDTNQGCDRNSQGESKQYLWRLKLQRMKQSSVQISVVLMLS